MTAIARPYYPVGQGGIGQVDPASGSWNLLSGEGAAWAAGDLAVFWLYSRTGTWDLSSPGGGVTDQLNSNAGGRLYIGYRILQTGDGLFNWSRSVSAAGSDTFWGTVIVKDVDTTTPIEAASSVVSGSATPDPSSVSGVTEGAAIITFSGFANDGTITGPSGFRRFAAFSSVAGSDGSCAIDVALNNAAGTVDPGSMSGPSATGLVYSISIRPAAALPGRVELVGTGDRVNTTTAALALTPPPSYLDGDVMIWFDTGTGVSGSAQTIPSGWTAIGNVDQSANINAGYKVATSSEGTATAQGTGGNATGRIMCFRGADTTSTPYTTPVTGFENSADTSLATGTFSVSGDNRFLACLWSRDGDSSSAEFGAFTDAAGPSNATVDNWGFTEGTGGGAAYSHERLTTGGTYGSITSTLTVGRNKAWILVPLIPIIGEDSGGEGIAGGGFSAWWIH